MGLYDGFSFSMEILMDLEDIFALPFGLGEKMQDAAGFIPRARHDDDDEYFLPPLVRPKVILLPPPQQLHVNPPP